MKYVPPIGGGANDPYVDADPGAAIEGSAVPAAAIEDPMRELVALITDAGLVPDEASLTQVAAAVRTLIQKQAPAVAIAGGTADAITAAFVPAITTDTAGRIPTVTLLIVAAAANTGAGLTINAGTGAFGVVKGAGAAIVAGDVAGAGHPIMVRGVRGANAAADKWVLLNPAKGVSTQAFASNAEAQALLVADKAVSPATLDAALKGANQSLGASGYQKLPGGLIIQWMLATESTNSATARSFPIAFPNACVALTGVSIDTDNVGLKFTSVTQTGYVIMVGVAYGTGSVSYVIAIGY